VRRPTLVILIVLFVLLVIAGVAQLTIASSHREPLNGPTSPGQLPSLSPASSP
jgi:flagellar basal body-associated protein FliL